MDLLVLLKAKVINICTSGCLRNQNKCWNNRCLGLIWCRIMDNDYALLGWYDKIKYKGVN